MYIEVVRMSDGILPDCSGNVKETRSGGIKFNLCTVRTGIDTVGNESDGHVTRQTSRLHTVECTVAKFALGECGV